MADSANVVRVVIPAQHSTTMVAKGTPACAVIHCRTCITLRSTWRPITSDTYGNAKEERDPEKVLSSGNEHSPKCAQFVASVHIPRGLSASHRSRPPIYEATKGTQHDIRAGSAKKLATSKNTHVVQLRLPRSAHLRQFCPARRTGGGRKGEGWTQFDTHRQPHQPRTVYSRSGLVARQLLKTFGELSLHPMLHQMSRAMAPLGELRSPSSLIWSPHSYEVDEQASRMLGSVNLYVMPGAPRMRQRGFSE